MYVTKEQIRQARKANLADYLLREYPADVKIVGASLYLKNNPSLYVKKAVPGYHDFSTGEHGNSIDFLTRYLNYSFTDAVLRLCRCNNVEERRSPESHPFCLPERAEAPFDRVVEYLTGRGIPRETVMELIRKGYLYQDVPYGNAVFVTPLQNYCEIRGTGSKPFHGCRKDRPDRFWCFMPKPAPIIAVYICEAAIDAISLMLIHQMQGVMDSNAYVSIGGVANQQAIDAFRNKNAILAVDNDSAGEECRKRNPDFPVLIPKGKDWNDDLRQMSLR